MCCFPGKFAYMGAFRGHMMFLRHLQFYPVASFLKRDTPHRPQAMFSQNLLRFTKLVKFIIIHKVLYKIITPHKVFKQNRIAIEFYTNVIYSQFCLASQLTHHHQINMHLSQKQSRTRIPEALHASTFGCVLYRNPLMIVLLSQFSKPPHRAP